MPGKDVFPSDPIPFPMYAEGETVKRIANIFVCLIILLSYSSAFAGKRDKEYPKTINQAVSILMNTLSIKDKEHVLYTPREMLIGEFHFTLGLYIRNKLIRNGGPNGGVNMPLIKSCARKDEIGIDGISLDGCSSIIVEALWKKIRAQAGAATVKALDAQYALIKKIKITNRNFINMNLGEVVDDINLQIADQIASLQGVGGMPTELIVSMQSICTTGSGGPISKSLGTAPTPLLQVFSFFEDRGWRVKRQPPWINLEEGCRN